MLVGGEGWRKLARLWSASYQIPSCYILFSTTHQSCCPALPCLACLPTLPALANLAAQSIEGVLTIA